MATVNVRFRYPVLGPDGEQLGALNQNTHSVTSSDPAVGDIQWLDWRPWFFAAAVGTTTLTATRYVDGAVTTLDVEVVAPELPPFVISLGEGVAF